MISNMSREERQKLYSTRLAREIDFDRVDQMGWCHFLKCDADDLLSRALYQDIKMYLPDDILALSDRLSMFHSIELRVPFVDHKVVEFCARMPAELKVKGLKKKYLLKKIAAKLLPPEIMRQPKQGFSSPMSYWMMNELRGFVTGELREGLLRQPDLFSPDSIKSIFEEQYAGRSRKDRLIFSLLMFQEWHHAYRG